MVCLNVVEHVEDDLGAMRNIRGVLAPGGRAIVLVPRGPDLFGTLDEVLGHKRRYTDVSLTRLAKEAGFEVQELLHFNRIGTPAWWLNGKLLKRRSFGLLQVKALNVLTPLFRLVDRGLPFPPLSLIALLRVPAAAGAGGEGPVLTPEPGPGRVGAEGWRLPMRAGGRGAVRRAARGPLHLQVALRRVVLPDRVPQRCSSVSISELRVAASVVQRDRSGAAAPSRPP